MIAHQELKANQTIRPRRSLTDTQNQSRTCQMTRPWDPCLITPLSSRWASLQPKKTHQKQNLQWSCHQNVTELTRQWKSPARVRPHSLYSRSSTLRSCRTISKLINLKILMAPKSNWNKTNKTPGSWTNYSHRPAETRTRQLLTSASAYQTNLVRVSRFLSTVMKIFRPTPRISISKAHHPQRSTSLRPSSGKRWLKSRLRDIQTLSSILKSPTPTTMNQSPVSSTLLRKRSSLQKVRLLSRSRLLPSKASGSNRLTQSRSISRTSSASSKVIQWKARSMPTRRQCLGHQRPASSRRIRSWAASVKNHSFLGSTCTVATTSIWK